MAIRSVIVRLEAQVAGYVAGLGRAATATDNLAKQAAQARNSVRDNSQAMDTAGTAYTLFGAAVVGGLAAATKAAIDWESAWAGVTKTVSGTPEQMDALEGSLRGLAKTLPATHDEIAGVAEAAGALGVAREDIVGFTKTMIDLGETTNLTSDDAATSIAQIANVTGLMAREGAEGVAKFGSALVALGNDGASTEAEILSMAQRIAGAGVQVGLSEGEILGLASALSSVGIEAEAGGSAISTVMIDIAAAVDQGGADLEKWAGAAGMTGEQFKQAFEEDAAGALQSLVTGLGNAEATGQTTLGMLEDLGITEIRTRDAMLRLASAGDLLGESFATGNTAFAENTALLEEATKRYETTEAKITIAWNNIKDAAIDAGTAMLPVVEGIATGAAGIAKAFGAIPEPVQGSIAMLGGVVGVSALAAGGFLTLVPRIVDTQKAFRDLNASGSKIPGVMGKIGKAAGIAAGGLVAFEVIKGINNATQPAVVSLEELTQALIGVKDNSGAIDEAFASIDVGTGGAILDNVNTIGQGLDKLINQGDLQTWVGSFGATVLGIDNDMAKLATAVERTDQAIATAVSSGNSDLAAQGFKAVADSAAEQGVSLEEVAAQFPNYLNALRQLASDAGESVSDQELLNWALGETPAAMEAAAGGAEEAAAAIEAEAAAAEQAARVSEEMAEALAEIGVSADGTVSNLTNFTNALVAAGLLNLSTRDSARQYQASIDSLSESLATNGTTLDINTEAGRANQAALDGIAKSGLAYAEALAAETDALGNNVNSQEQVQAALQQTYDDYYANALAMTGNAEAAEALTREVMGIPDNVTIESFMADTAKLMAEDTTGAAIAVPDMVAIDSWMSEAAKATGDATKKSAEDVPDQITVESWMSDAAFIEAIRTRAAELNIPPEVAVKSFMESAARNEADATTAEVLGIPEGASVSSFMSNYARVEAQNLTGALNAIDGRVVVATAIMKEITEKQVIDLGTARAGTPVRAGQMGRNATGGRLPITGPGTDRTDGILGLSEATGAPISWLDGGEHITSRAMTNKHSDLLWAIHRDDPRLSSIGGLAGGGRLSREYAVASSYLGSGGTPAVNLVAIVENPWTGEQVQAVVKQVATSTADQRINTAARGASTVRRGARG